MNMIPDLQVSFRGTAPTEYAKPASSLTTTLCVRPVGKPVKCPVRSFALVKVTGSVGSMARSYGFSQLTEL
jgi:hypothetical protein